MISGKESLCQWEGPRRHRFSPWAGKIPWRRKWPLIPLFLPGKSPGQKSLVDCCPGSLKELNMTEHARTCHAKSLQSCPTLCDPIDGSPPGSPIPGILQARTLERVAISFSNA